MGEENFQIIGADGTVLFFCFRPPSLVLPPSDEGGGKRMRALPVLPPLCKGRW